MYMIFYIYYDVPFHVVQSVSLLNVRACMYAKQCIFSSFDLWVYFMQIEQAQIVSDG